MKSSSRVSLHRETASKPELPTLSVLPSDLTQAILNLIVNAADATVGDSTIWLRASVHDATQVQLSVTDCGRGMTQAVRERALEPFFTTKARSVSTVLGLAVVHGLVERVGGTMAIESSESVGTQVSLFLPIAKAA